MYLLTVNTTKYIYGQGHDVTMPRVGMSYRKRGWRELPVLKLLITVQQED